MNDSKGKSMVLAKDSLGTLWITYTVKGDVMVNHSVGGDRLRLEWRTVPDLAA